LGKTAGKGKMEEERQPEVTENDLLERQDLSQM